MKAAKVLFYGNKADREVILLVEQGNLLSAYKQVGDKSTWRNRTWPQAYGEVNKATYENKESGGEPDEFQRHPALEFSETRIQQVTIVPDRRTVFKLDIDMDVRLTIA